MEGREEGKSERVIVGDSCLTRHRELIWFGEKTNKANYGGTDEDYDSASKVIERSISA